MVEAGAGRDRTAAVLQRLTRRREHGAIGPGQRSGHRWRPVAKAIGLPAAENVGDERRIMGDAELFGADR